MHNDFRMHVVWTVLAAAKDVGDAHITAVCRGLIVKYRAGRWNKGDYALVREFYDVARGVA